MNQEPTMTMDLTRGLYRRDYADRLHDRRFDRLSLLAENLYRRAHLVADDFGRFRGDPALLLVDCFPLRLASLGIQDVEKALQEAVDAGLVTRYEVEGEAYGLLVDYESRQPAGKNGRRVMRFPGSMVNPGESGGIQGSPIKSRCVASDPVRPNSMSISASATAIAPPPAGARGTGEEGEEEAKTETQKEGPRPPLADHEAEAATIEAFADWGSAPLTPTDIKRLQGKLFELNAQCLRGTEIRLSQLVPHAIRWRADNGPPYRRPRPTYIALSVIETVLKKWAVDPSLAAEYVDLNG